MMVSVSAPRPVHTLSQRTDAAAGGSGGGALGKREARSRVDAQSVRWWGESEKRRRGLDVGWGKTVSDGFSESGAGHTPCASLSLSL